MDELPNEDRGPLSNRDTYPHSICYDVSRWISLVLCDPVPNADVEARRNEIEHEGRKDRCDDPDCGSGFGDLCSQVACLPTMY